MRKRFADVCKDRVCVLFCVNELDHLTSLINPAYLYQPSRAWSRQEKKDKIQLMSEKQANNPLHGITLEQIVNSLVNHYGWNELGNRINIRCFTNDPSVKSSLKFLRKTPWARTRVEELFIATQKKAGK